MHQLQNYIQQSFGQLPKPILETISSYFFEENLLKHSLFAKADAYCYKLSFLEKGLIRFFSTADGKDVTQWISTEGYFVTDVGSFFFNLSCRWNIEALTEVKLLSIQKSDYEKLCSTIPEWNEIEKVFIAKCFTLLENRIFTHLSMTAEERYQAYFEQYKSLFNRVSLKYLASILGMTPETFSRIRKKQLA